MRVSLTILSALVALWPCLLLSQNQGTQAQGIDNWYQVDVILFRQTSSDLNEDGWNEEGWNEEGWNEDGLNEKGWNEEGWPDFEPIYPRGVIAVTKPEPFRLSLLEQMAVQQSGADKTRPPGSDEFLFAGQSRERQSRRAIGALTGTQYEDAAKPFTKESEAQEYKATPAEPAGEADIDALLAAVAFTSPGQSAFSLTDNTSSLRSILRSLNRSSNYAVLSHHSWIQPITNEPTPVMVQSGGRYDDRYELEGTLSLSRSRYLHVTTDIWYTRFEPRNGARNPRRKDFQTSLPDETLKAYPELVEAEMQRGLYRPAGTHAMRQSRRMRSGELHYMDHPLFGIFIRVNRYEPGGR